MPDVFVGRAVAAAPRLATLACLACVALALGGCSDSPVAAYCTAPASLAVQVMVRDSTSGQAAATGATGTLVGAGTSDTLFHVDSLTMVGGTQLGSYEITIDRPGYLTWRASNVRVTQKGPCGNVLPVDLSARLQPATP